MQQYLTPTVQFWGAVTISSVIGVLALRTLWSQLKSAQRKRRTADRMKSQQRDVVYVFGFPRFFDGLPGMSAPVVKLETFLRLAKIPYVISYSLDTSDSPTQTFPYIELNGVATSQSHFIIERLVKHFAAKVSLPVLSEKQEARGVALRRLSEDSLRLHYYRHLNVDNAPFIVNEYARALNYPKWAAGYFVNRIMRPKTIAMLNAVGHGDLTDEQYHQEFMRDVKALEVLLSESPFACGDAPSIHDAEVYAYLSTVSFMAQHVPCAAMDFVKKSAVLKAYLDRITATAWPDLAAITNAEARKAPSHSFTFDK